MLSVVRHTRTTIHGTRNVFAISSCWVYERSWNQVTFSTSATVQCVSQKLDEAEIGGVPVAPVAKKKFGYVDVDGVLRRDKESMGLFYLNTQSLPPVLKTNLAKYLKEFPRKLLEADGAKLARHLKNRGRPTSRTWKKYKESRRTRKLKEQELEAEFRKKNPVRVVQMNDLEEEEEEKDDAERNTEEAITDEEVKDAIDEDSNISKSDSYAEDDNKLKPSEQIDNNNDNQETKRKNKKGPPKSPKLPDYKVIRYNRRETAAFASSRVPACYGSTLRVFHEIARREPEFKPETLLDFGSGVGTTVWAANEKWGDSIKEYQCVDISEEMNRTSELLLRGGNSSRQPLHIPGVYFKRFLPVSNKITYDVVVASYALSELPFVKLRKAALLNLWRKANRFLVIIEYGNNEGFEITLEARNLVVEKEHAFPMEEPENIPNIDTLGLEDEEELPAGHVFAPCPHDMSCERSDVDTRKKPCSFEQRVQLSLAQERTKLKRWSHAKESFSYIVLEKGTRSESADPWPRILEPVKKRKRHIITSLCCGSGIIEKRILTIRKDSDIYKCVRHCNHWGDLMPSPESRIRPVKHGPKLPKKNRWETWKKNKEARMAAAAAAAGTELSDDNTDDHYDDLEYDDIDSEEEDDYDSD